MLHKNGILAQKGGGSVAKELITRSSGLSYGGFRFRVPLRPDGVVLQPSPSGRDFCRWDVFYAIVDGSLG